MSGFAVTRSYHFSAAHQLANAALSDEENARVYGQCFRPHGHNYVLEVTVAGTLDPATGMSVDLAAVDAAVKAAVLDRVDHYDLSATVPALAGVITTGENLVRTFYQWIESALPPGRLNRVTLVETANNVFEYSGETAPAR
ncbi:MAG: 6-carboxytetrahydropterin synthase [Candidatus Rokuibacteriota bacterium]